MKCERIIQAARNSIPAGSPIAREIESRIDCITWAPGYAEPGYSDPEAGVFFGDWNTISVYNRETQRCEEYLPGHNIVKRLGDLLEKAGAEIEWYDEWTTCCDCGKAIRTSANSYCWTPYFVWANECEIVCLDCADESVLDQYINEPRKCVPPYLKKLLVRAGFEQINRDEYENGFHPGQNDDPQKIFVEESKHCDELIFVQDEQSQFYIRFSVWGRSAEKHSTDGDAGEEGSET